MDELPKSVSEVSTPPPTENLGRKIILFGRVSCPDCARVKKYFAENAIEYENLDIDSNKEALNWVQSFSSHVPVLIMMDQSIMYSPSSEDLHQKIAGSSVNQKVSLTEPDVYDTIIIGAGASGIAAAIYAVRKSLKVLMVSKDIGGQAALSGGIENYPGFTMISGLDLAAKFRDEIERFKGDGLWVKEGVAVTSIEGSEGKFVVKTATNSYHSRTVIIASGRVPKMLGIVGEKEFFGKGVATCATCDAPLYKGRDVAVVGGGNSALDAAFSLMKLAKSVTIVNITESLRGDDILLKNVTEAADVLVLNNYETLEVIGQNSVEGLKIKNKASGEEKVLNVNGIFVEIGWKPSIDFVPPQVEKNDKNEIVVDEFGKTSFDGIWAAGDVNNLWGEQIVIAAGEGAKAGLMVAEHIGKLPHQATSNIHHGE